MATQLAKIVADFRTTLATEIAVGGTSGTLQSVTDADGNAIPNGTYFLTLDGDGTAKEYVKCTVTGTALTSIRTISRQGVQASGTVRKHRIGAKVQITNFAHIKYMLDLLDGTTDFDASTPLRYDAIPTITSGMVETLATVDYVNSVALAGAPDAQTNVKGVIQLATVAQQGTATATGSTGANLVPANANLVKTSSGAGDENKIAVLSADGTFHQTFLNSARTWTAVQSATAANLQVTTDPSAANDAVRNSYLAAQLTAEVPKGGISGTSGEAITAGQGVYIKASDSKLYKTDADADESTFSFVGIALTTVAGADLAVTYAPPGHIVSGLAGLTAGASYYITGTAGTLGTTPGTRYARVARALSTTVLQVVDPKFVARGVIELTSGTAAGSVTTVTTGFYPGDLQFFWASSDNDGNTVNIKRHGYGNLSGTFTDNGSVASMGNLNGAIGALAYRFEVGSSQRWDGAVARSATGFTVSHNRTAGSAPLDPYLKIYWTAESL